MSELVANTKPSQPPAAPSDSVQSNSVSPPSQHDIASGFFTTTDGRRVEIRDVWASNLEEEMEIIRELVEKYNYVAMDTEFPGVVARPTGDFSASDVQYQTLRCNVDLLKLIQLGLSFTDSEGNWADGCTCWQFNFKFSLTDDMFAQDSIDLLKTSGIDFNKFEQYGIDIHYFGELLMMSGLVLTNDVKWVSFHSSYDFGYLLKTLTCTELPADEQVFFDLLHTYFPNIFDVKYMMTAVEGMYGGLSSLADSLQVERIGPMHQAGSDSLLTAQTYFSLIRKHLGPSFDEKSSRFRGQLYGLGDNHTKYKGKYNTGSSASSSSSSSSVSTTMSMTQGVHYPQGSAMHASSSGNNITMLSGGAAGNQSQQTGQAQGGQSIYMAYSSAQNSMDDSTHLQEGY